MFRVALIVTLTFCTFFASAQQIYQEKFGKNRVQYKKFLWQYLTTYNFDIYFHYGGEDMARYTADYAEREIARISHEIDYNPYRRYKIFIYNSVSDLEQSNIGLETGEFIGGQTSFVKPIMEVAFEGNVNQFKQQISYEIAKTLLSFMMYGGSLGNAIRSSFLLSLPDWYLDGAASYIAYGWTPEMDNYMRKKIALNKLHSPATYRGAEAKIIGHSVWNYISEVYGPTYINRMMNITRLYRKEKKSIQAGLDVPYKEFVKNWIAYYKNDSGEYSDQYDLADRSLRIKKRNRSNKKYYEVKINPEATYMAYASNKLGKYRVFVKNIKTGHTKRLRSGSYKRYDQMIGYNNPALAWSKDELLSVVTYKKGKAHHKLYDFKNHKRKTRGLGDFNQTLSFAYSTDGDFVVLSGDVRGKTDIWVWDLKRNNLKQVTMDPYNDLDPVFVPDSHFEFVFSSSRPTETDALSDSSLNLFLYDYRNGKMQALTNEGNNTHPVFKNKNELYFLSDRTGISNVFCYYMSTGELKQITHFFYDVTDFSMGQKTSDLFSYALNEGGKSFIYIDSLSKYEPSSISPYTPMAEKKLAKKRALNHNPSNDENTQHVVNADNEKDFDFDKLIFRSEDKKKSEQKNRELRQKQVKDSLAAITQAEMVKVKGPYKYKKLFAMDQVTTGIMADPLRGIGLLLDGQMSDLLQNNRFDLGLFIPLNLGIPTFKQINMYAEYLMLKHRFDFKFRYDRVLYNVNSDSVAQTYTLNRFTVGISYPINVHQRISLSPNVFQTRWSDISDPNTITVPDVTNLYLGAKAEWVYDYTRYYGLNMKAGHMAKVFVETNHHATNSSMNYGEFGVDIRHYQPIHKALLLAIRMSYGQFFGASPKNYILGGMDNWINSSANTSNASSPLQEQYLVNNSDILLDKFVMSMRGFKYGTQFGQSHLLFNAELRFPIAQYFYKGTIGSAFFRNLQLIGFTDIGSAWTGGNPFNSDNNINTQTINQYPFRVVVTNYRSPFLIGYGAGVRSLLMGYYLKLDVAWGIQNGVSTSSPMLYFTLGHDF